jgi:putative ABC transport system substrate-binding protein
MRRREFITLLGGAAAWPVAARAQQSAIPIVGFLRSTRAEDSGHLLAALRQGLRESGYPTDKVTIESRWAEGRPEQLPKLAGELVALNPAAIVGNAEAVRAAKKATTSIPIIFVTGLDPVTIGLVSSINRPDGNITGVSFFDVPVIGKRLALLRELVPKAEIIAVLHDPNFVAHDAETHEIEEATRAIGAKIVIFKAAREQEIDSAFSAIMEWARTNVERTGARSHRVPRHPSELFYSRICGGRRIDELWLEHDRYLPPRRYLCGEDSQGRETWRASS